MKAIRDTAVQQMLLEFAGHHSKVASSDGMLQTAKRQKLKHLI